MGQTFTEDTFAGDHVGQTDLQNMETNFLTLRSNFSGSGSPALPALPANRPGITWFDTDDNSFKIRDNTGNVWRGVMCGNNTTPIWMYVNAAPNGWVITGSFNNKIIAVKGGTAYPTGGVDTGGGGTITGHQLSVAELPAHAHDVNNTGAHTHTLTANNGITHNNTSGWGQKDTSPAAKTTSSDGDHIHVVDGGGSGTSLGNAHTHPAYTPAAAVGIMVYPVYT